MARRSCGNHVGRTYHDTKSEASKLDDGGVFALDSNIRQKMDWIGQKAMIMGQKSYEEK